MYISDVVVVVGTVVVAVVVVVVVVVGIEVINLVGEEVLTGFLSLIFCLLLLITSLDNGTLVDFINLCKDTGLCEVTARGLYRLEDLNDLKSLNEVNTGFVVVDTVVVVLVFVVVVVLLLVVVLVVVVLVVVDGVVLVVVVVVVVVLIVVVIGGKVAPSSLIIGVVLGVSSAVLFLALSIK